MRKSKIALAIGSAAVVISVAILGCGGSRDIRPADTVLRNGYIYTVDNTDSVQEAVAVRDGIIVYVGKNDGVQDYVGPSTKVIELGGRMMMPGLVDGHLHVLAGGKALLGCDLQYAPLSISQVKGKIQECLDASKDSEPDGWLEVANWDRQSTFAISGSDPSKATLDALSTTRPILVTSTDFHTAWVNSRALVLAGINAATVDPAGGRFVRDGANSPTGICDDQAGFVIRGVIPPSSDAEYVTQGRAALEAFRQAGITTFMDAASTEQHFKVFSALKASNELTARVQLAFQVLPEAAQSNVTKVIADAKALALKYDHGPSKSLAPGINFHVLKLFADGVVNAPADTGGLLSPYFMNAGSDSAPNWVAGTNMGADYFPPDILQPLLLEAAKSGFDVHVHATGERAVRQILDAVQNVRTKMPVADFRPAIAHDETVDPADYGRFKGTDTTATMSFQWAVRAPYSIGDTENHLGPQRFARMEPFGSLRNAGGRVAFGSDWPIDPLDEFLALKAGVTRSGDPINPHSASSLAPIFEGKINGDPALSRMDALRAITMSAAYQLRMETQVGSIEVGKFADLIVLERNFMKAAEDDLARNRVLITMVGGKIVMGQEGFASTVAAAARPTHLRAIDIRAASTGVTAAALHRNEHVH